MIQNLNKLNEFHNKKDPWGYKKNPEDIKRLDALLREIPKRDYENVLDIGCGQGYITNNLPGKNILGIDISESAIKHAKSNNIKLNTNFRCSSIFDLENVVDDKYDLIIITGVLYPQYIGKSSSLIYKIIDNLLNEDSFFICVHINEWYSCQFPFFKLKEEYYSYRNFNHKLEIYAK